MHDRIKLVYSWIGPRGPVWNTELPNILNFANVADGVEKLNTTRFWADDAQMFFDSRSLSSDYETYPVCSITDDDRRHFLLPFTLTWRIPFERYFSGNEGILEFSHVPHHIINLIKRKNGFIMINHSIEAFMNPGYIDVLHSYFDKVHHIPLYKIIYLTGCINATELYEEYCNTRNIPNDPAHRLSVVTFATSFNSFKENTKLEEDMPPYDTETVPPKLFLMWNRRIRGHRVEMAVNLERYNVVERSLISFSDVDADMPGNSVVPRFDYPRLGGVFGIEPHIVDRFVNRLPLILDGANDVTEMCQDYGNPTRHFYQQSLISIITETNYYDREVSLTEKSFKPTKEKHPFIIVGVNGALKGMRDLGFRTFGEFWDESYDDIEDPGERMRKLMDIVGQISTWTPEQIVDFRRRVKPILDHNYEVIRNASPTRSIEKITNIIRGQQ